VVDSGPAEQDLLRAAFGDDPGLRPVSLADPVPRRRWLAAVVLGGQGRYAAAATLLERLWCDRNATVAVRAHAAVTRAAHLRQLGGHAAARGWDARGLALATGVDRSAGAGVDERPTDPEGLGREAARLDALVGLAADALGLGALGTADRLLGRVEREDVKQISWRPSVRLSWVRAELDLARGRPEAAAAWADRAVALSREAGAVRHEIKSEIISAVAASATGVSRVIPVNRLNELAERAADGRLDTLEWVARCVLGDLMAESEPDRAAGQRASGLAILAQIRRSSDPLGRSVFDGSPWVPNVSGS
jgi:hypothetical protein